MLELQKIKLHHKINWQDYLALPGNSFSGLKNIDTAGKLEENEGMRMGKMVHTYLLKPDEYTWEQPEAVIPIAKKLTEFCSPGVLRSGEVECGATAVMVHEGLAMLYKGLLDWHLFKFILIDFKIIAGDLDHYIKRFAYDQQVIGYAMPVEAQVRLIIAYNKKTTLIQTAFIKHDPRWWEHQVKKYGKPLNHVYDSQN